MWCCRLLGCGWLRLSDFAFCLFCVNFGIRFGYQPLAAGALPRKSSRLRQLLAFTATWLVGPWLRPRYPGICFVRQLRCAAQVAHWGFFNCVYNKFRFVSGETRKRHQVAAASQVPPKSVGDIEADTSYKIRTQSEHSSIPETGAEFFGWERDNQMQSCHSKNLNPLIFYIGCSLKIASISAAPKVGINLVTNLFI